KIVVWKRLPSITVVTAAPGPSWLPRDIPLGGNQLLESEYRSVWLSRNRLWRDWRGSRAGWLGCLFHRPRPASRPGCIADRYDPFPSDLLAYFTFVYLPSLGHRIQRGMMGKAEEAEPAGVQDPAHSEQPAVQECRISTVSS